MGVVKCITDTEYLTTGMHWTFSFDKSNWSTEL